MKMSTVHMLSNRKAARIFHYGLACAYTILLLLYEVLSDFKGILVVAALIGLYFVRHADRVLNDPKYHPVAALSPIIEIVLLFLLFLRSGTEIESIVFVLFVADLLLYYKSWYALPLAYGGFIVYTLLWPADGEDLWQYVFYFLSYTCLVIPIWSTKLLLNQRDINLRLSSALMQEARTREEIAALRERTTIAEEVHDTVGHTLTTAIVALEGAQLLFDTRPDEARRKILVARMQLKEGLGNIRQVVRTLKAKEGRAGSLGLEEGIRKIMTDTTRQTDVQIHLQYEMPTQPISLQEYVIRSIVKESITNALKHGRASRIEISVLERQNAIDIRVRDNGTGSDSVLFGFGLSSMEERIQAIGGQLSVHAEPKAGFTVHARMPVAMGEEA